MSVGVAVMTQIHICNEIFKKIVIAQHVHFTMVRTYLLGIFWYCTSVGTTASTLK